MTDRTPESRILDDPGFRALAREHHRVAGVLTAITLAVYYGFVFLLAFDPAWFGRKVTERIPLGIPVGIGVIVISCALTGVYVLWANRRHDAAVSALRKRIEDAASARPDLHP